ncbi:cytochrome c family protein [Massilia sp. YIM B02443]|uniref:c-type cytochrome n=1 Tax=Massilia sp. YIM B02443 TaxID=3050127 RepID=UPI0025B672C9|nr:c-type cytochrome [Massilia sp. YIM B02443]MDN4036854.1 c-type cytochrome [Massilia sp. YIM B02443]
MKRSCLAMMLSAAALLLAGCGADRPPPGVQGDPQRGKIALTQYACHSCHVVPGVAGSQVYVGRPLDDLSKRRYIAGKVPNNQASLVRFILDPQALDPGTAMPTLGVSERDALDISAYLLSK